MSTDAATADTAAAAPTATAPPARTSATWLRLLEAWVVAMGAFGLAIATVPWVSKEFFNWVAFGDTAERPAISAEARDYLHFNHTLMGALTIGLAVALWWLVRIPLRRGEAWAWWAIVSALASWFVIDCVASATTGYPRNVALNVALAAPVVPLLWAARPAPVSAAG